MAFTQHNFSERFYEDGPCIATVWLSQSLLHAIPDIMQQGCTCVVTHVGLWVCQVLRAVPKGARLLLECAGAVVAAAPSKFKVCALPTLHRCALCEYDSAIFLQHARPHKLPVTQRLHTAEDGRHLLLFDIQTAAYA